MTGAVVAVAAGTGIGVLGAAALHKLRVLARGEAAAQPLLRSVPFGLPAGAALAAALLAELAAVALLVWRPVAGCAACALLVAGYSLRLRGLAPGEPCACFGAAGRGGARAALVRNAVLLVVLSAGIAAGVAGGHAGEPLPLAGIALGLLLCAVLALRAQRAASAPQVTTVVWPPPSVEEALARLRDREPVDAARAAAGRLSVTLLQEGCGSCRALVERQREVPPQPDLARVALVARASRTTRRDLGTAFDLVLVDRAGAAGLRPPFYPATVLYGRDGAVEAHAFGRGPGEL